MGQSDTEGFPQPRQNPGGEPCGECHLQPAETCDVCGATEPEASNDPAPTSEAINRAVATLIAAGLPEDLEDRIYTWNAVRLRMAADTVKSRADLVALFAGIPAHDFMAAGIS